MSIWFMDNHVVYLLWNLVIGVVVFYVSCKYVGGELGTVFTCIFLISSAKALALGFVMLKVDVFA